MAYEPTIKMDYDQLNSLEAKGYVSGVVQAGFEDWPADYWTIQNKDGVPVVVPVVGCDPYSVWGTLDTNVSPAKFAVAAITNSNAAEYMSPPNEESGVPGVEAVVRVMRGYANQDEALAALRTELEV